MNRNQVAHTLATILEKYTIEDMSVEDPPLEDVIAQVFSQVNVAGHSGQLEDNTEK
ncbi:MAG: ABC-2 type transport system ATP-binding protein [Pirellulaceae bacterium]